VLPQMSALNLRSSLWKSRSAPLSWTRELPKSNTRGRKFSSVEFHPGMDVGGEDTMGTGRPSGMSTIIKSIPPSMLSTPLKARALSDLCYTSQTTFRIDFHHKELKWQEKLHTILKNAFISTHSLGKASCSI
jgi:hypothetical protein